MHREPSSDILLMSDIDSEELAARILEQMHGSDRADGESATALLQRAGADAAMNARRAAAAAISYINDRVNRAWSVSG